MSIYVCNECGGSLSTNGGNNMVPTRAGFTIHAKCATCGKRFTIFTDTNMHEISRQETRQKTPRAPNWRQYKTAPATVCWHCQKACGGPSGCSWFNGFKPVPGWEAISNTIQYEGTQKGLTSYTVIKCPEFIADNRKAGA